MRLVFAVLGFVVLIFPGCGPNGKKPTPPQDARIAELLGRMTPEEKFRQLFMVPGSLDLGAEKPAAGIIRPASRGRGC